MAIGKPWPRPSIARCMANARIHGKDQWTIRAIMARREPINTREFANGCVRESSASKCAAMRMSLKYESHVHKKATKRMYTVNNPMIYLAENATKFTAEEMCRDISFSRFSTRAQVE